MRRDPNEDLAPATGILLAGLLVPLVVVALVQRPLAMYLTGRAFTVLAAGAFGIVAWLLLEARDLDRPNFLVASVVVPGGALVALLFLAPVVADNPAVEYLLGDGGVVRYLAAFGIAGFGAVGLSRVAEDAGHVPEPRRVAVGLGVGLVLVVALVGGVNHVTASSTSVSAVEPGVYDRVEAFAVTVAGPPAERRVTVVAPDGTSATTRLSRADTRGGSATAVVPVTFDTPPAPGRLPLVEGVYRVRVSTLAGATVATAEYTVEEEPLPAVLSVRTASGELTWDDRPDRTVAPAPVHETKVAVLVENRAPLPTDVALWLRPPGDGPGRAVETEVRPGERVALVLSLPPETVGRLRAEQDGVATVELSREHEVVLIRAIDLPEE